MPIRDVSGLPDDQVPEWVRRSRERARHQRMLLCGTCNLHFGIRKEVEQHCEQTGHTPLVVTILRKGPSMADYREDLRRFGAPPRVSLAERFVVLATGNGAKIEAVMDDAIHVIIYEAAWELSQLDAACAILGVTLTPAGASDVHRWFTLTRRAV